MHRTDCSFVVLAILAAEAELQPAELDATLAALPVRQQRQWLRLMQGALRALAPVKPNGT
jgi:hypothetical protein